MFALLIVVEIRPNMIRSRSLPLPQFGLGFDGCSFTIDYVPPQNTLLSSGKPPIIF